MARGIFAWAVREAVDGARVIPASVSSTNDDDDDGLSLETASASVTRLGDF